MHQRYLHCELIGLWKVHAQRPEEATRAQNSYSHKRGGRSEGLRERQPMFSASYGGESRSLSK